MDFSVIIKKIRVLQGITQEELARELNVSFSTINRWENNRAVASKLAKMRLIEYCESNKRNIPELEELSKLL